MSADGEIVRTFIATNCHAMNKTPALAALARLEVKGEAYDNARATVKIEGNTRAFYVLRAERAEAQRDALVSALRTICDIGETRDVEVARAALADVGLIADSDTTTEWKS